MCTAVSLRPPAAPGIIVSRHRHDELVEALAPTFLQFRVGGPFDKATQMGPLAMSCQRDQVLGYIEKGTAEGATPATGGGRPAHLEKGWFVEPTVVGNVDNSSTIAQEEVLGPVLHGRGPDGLRHRVTRQPWASTDTGCHSRHVASRDS
ncbi:aldehyde dehydrogenase family protein [Pseudonocardia sp. N23]|uniref:aldehyde dehydrogenase family protein n=1 Tax=Pseudonocardia sp. N23 TaxID=1987376 RepID=UPI000BFD3A6D|nr:aldehyde dehydrogenase family protein [Pseudonocardia sp. N23]